MIIFVILAMIICASIQGWALTRRQQWGELAVSGLLWMMAMALVFLAILDVPLPGSSRIFFPLFERIYDFLGIQMLP